MTREQLQEWFSQLDTDGDGKASIEEIENNYATASVFKSLSGTLFFESLMRHDSDKDGSLTFEELVAAVEKAGNLQQ